MLYIIIYNLISLSTHMLLLVVLTEAPQRSLIRNNSARGTDMMGIILTFILIQQDVSP